MSETSGRLFRLLALLQARRFWSGAELASQLEVTERTIRRDVDRLRALGYPVASSTGVAGGYSLAAGSALPPLLLEDDEAVAIVLGLSSTAAGSVSGMEEAALRALAKLTQVLPARLSRRVEALHGAVDALTFGVAPVRADVLTSLAAGCRDHEQRRFRYEDAGGRATERTVEPHGLVHAGSRWYLVAFDTEREDWRTFRVDRIAGAVTAARRFTPREVPGGSAAAFVSRSVSTDAYTYRARVIVQAPLARLAARLSPLVAQLEPLDDDRCRLITGGATLDALAFHLALLGEPLEVEEPPELIARMRQLSERLAAASGSRASESTP